MKAFLLRAGIESVTLTAATRYLLTRVPERIEVQGMLLPPGPPPPTSMDDPDFLRAMVHAPTPQSRFVHLQRGPTGSEFTWLSFPIRPILQREYDEFLTHRDFMAGRFILLGTEEWARALWQVPSLGIVALAMARPNLSGEIDPDNFPGVLKEQVIVQTLLHPYERQGLIGAIAKLSGFSDEAARQMSLGV